LDPQLQTLVLQLADTTIRNTAGSIADRIATVKARKKDQDTIAELEEIISGLLSDKNELVRIAQAFEQELVAQRISQVDIEYISTNFVPLIQRLAEIGSQQGSGGEEAQEMLDLIRPILSVETVTVLQLLGFNFRKAIGEPLTELVAKLIMSKAQANPELGLEIQRLTLSIANDSEAYARLATMLGTQQAGDD
jgi:hypothetical protein